MRLLPLLPLALLIAGCDRQESANRQAEPASDATPAASTGGIDRSQAGKPAPAVAFRNEEGEETSLADYRGKPVLLNLWATWCAPCVKELPTLAALADRPGAPQVLALSQDSTAPDKVAAFLAGRNLDLAPLQDQAMAMSGALGVNILPTTVLYGSDGREIWRYSGDLDWTGAEAAKLLAEAT